VQIRVGNSGFETIPVLGPVRVVGSRRGRWSWRLKTGCERAEILSDADVQVSLVQSQTSQFSVLGQVPRPGAYALARPDMRLMEGLALAAEFRRR